MHVNISGNLNLTLQDQNSFTNWVNPNTLEVTDYGICNDGGVVFMFFIVIGVYGFCTSIVKYTSGKQHQIIMLSH